MNKINANQFPITLSLSPTDARWNSRYLSKFNGIIEEINGIIDAGEIIVSHNKDIRQSINNVVDAAFKSYINERFCYGGQWESLPEDIQHIGYDTPNEARLIPAFLKKLRKVKSQDHAVVQDSYKLCAELTPLTDVVAHFKTIEVKATAKRAAVKAQKAEEVRIKNDTDVVYKAVLPLKVLAMNKAEEHFRESVRQAAALILKHNGDLDKLVPIPEDIKYDSHEYQALTMARGYYISITNNFAGRLSLSDTKVEEEVQKTRQAAGFQFDAFVAKLNAKINDVVLTAELSGDPWNYSTLVVETKNKGRQVWQTKIIVNVSKLGKLFNQWPTRQVS